MISQLLVRRLSVISQLGSSQFLISQLFHPQFSISPFLRAQVLISQLLGSQVLKKALALAHVLLGEGVESLMANLGGRPPAKLASEVRIRQSRPDSGLGLSHFQYETL